MSELESLPELGFVIVRHVNNETTNEYWQESYRCIRKFYSAKTYPILIVDDNSDPKYLKSDIKPTDYRIAYGEFKGAGEILGYFYFHKLHFAKKAVIIHDSVFLNSHIDFTQFGEARSLWSFGHQHDEDPVNLELISRLNNCGEIIRTHLNKKKWLGCFGIMSVISWNLLDRINSRYNFFHNIIPYITGRHLRSCMERVFACTCTSLYPEFGWYPHIIKDIYIHGWGLTYQEYKSGIGIHLPIIKVWTGR